MRALLSRTVWTAVAIAATLACAAGGAEAPDGRPKPRPRRPRLVAPPPGQPPVPPPPVGPGPEPVPAPAPGEPPPPTPAVAAPAPNVTLFLDVLGRTSFEDNDLVIGGVNADDRVAPRVAELQIDSDRPGSRWFLSGTFAEGLPWRYDAALDEAYVVLTGSTPDGWPEGLTVTAGRFRTALGRANAWHVHEMPEATRSYTVQAFLGPDGDRQEGLGVSYGTPSGRAPNAFRGTLQVVRGAGTPWIGPNRPEAPAGIASLRGRLGSDAVTADFGWSGGLGVTDRSGWDLATLGVLDLRLAWSPYRKRILVVFCDAEVFLLDRHTPTAEVHSGGGTGTLGVALPDQASLAIRYDWTRYPDRPREREWAAGLWLTWTPVAWGRVRAGYEHRERTGLGDLETLFVQCTLAIGAGGLPRPAGERHAHD